MASLDAEIVQFVASLEARFGPTVLGMLMRGAVEPDGAPSTARVPHESLGSASHRYALDQIAEAALEYHSMMERRNRLAAEADPTAVTDSEAFDRFAKRWRARQTWRDRLMLAGILSVLLVLVLDRFVRPPQVDAGPPGVTNEQLRSELRDVYLQMEVAADAILRTSERVEALELQLEERE